MDSKILEEKMELLRWIINLNDEQVIKNLINFKNEIFGVPFKIRGSKRGIFSRV